MSVVFGKEETSDDFLFLLLLLLLLLLMLLLLKLLMLKLVMLILGCNGVEKIETGEAGN